MLGILFGVVTVVDRGDGNKGDTRAGEVLSIGTTDVLDEKFWGQNADAIPTKISCDAANA